MTLLAPTETDSGYAKCQAIWLAAQLVSNLAWADAGEDSGFNPGGDSCAVDGRASAGAGAPGHQPPRARHVYRPLLLLADEVWTSVQSERVVAITKPPTRPRVNSLNAIGPDQSVNFCPRLKPLLDQQTLGIGNARRVVHRHDLADHHLLVNRLGVLADEGF